MRTFTLIANDTYTEGQQIYRRYIPFVSTNDMVRKFDGSLFLTRKLRLFGFYDTSTTASKAFLNLQLNPKDKHLLVKKKWLEKFELQDYEYPYGDKYVALDGGFPQEVELLLYFAYH